MVVTSVHIHFGTTSTPLMRRRLLALLNKHRWDVKKAAGEMGIHPISLQRIIRKDEVLAEARALARYKLRQLPGRGA